MVKFKVRDETGHTMAPLEGEFIGQEAINQATELHTAGYLLTVDKAVIPLLDVNDYDVVECIPTGAGG